jgi:hypothetical protein
VAMGAIAHSASILPLCAFLLGLCHTGAGEIWRD